MAGEVGECPELVEGQDPDIRFTMEWFVYILKCSDNSYYVGITKDLSKRIQRHNAGHGAKYTRARKPVKLIWSERQASMSQALRRERQIKCLRREKKEMLIKGLLDKL